jgi:hypothetical protein
MDDYSKKRAELEQFYERLYNEDTRNINKIAEKRYGDDPGKMKAFLEGYKYSILHPYSKTIRLIVMYTLDYIPYYRKVPHIKNIGYQIREIFRNNIYKGDESFNCV